MAEPTTNSEVEKAVLKLARKPRPGDPGTPEDPLSGLQPTLDMMSGKSDVRPGDPGTPQDTLRNVQPTLDQLRAKAAATGIASQKAAKAAKEEEEVDVVDPAPTAKEPALATEVAESAGVEEAEADDTTATEEALEAAGVDETDSEQDVAEKTGKVTGNESPVETEERRGMFGPVEKLTLPQLRRQARQERRALRGQMRDITGENAEDMLMAARAAGGTKAEIQDRRQQKQDIRRAMRGKGVPSRGNVFQSGREAAAAKALAEADAKALEDIKEDVEDVADSAAETAGGGAPRPKAPAQKTAGTSFADMDGMTDEELADFDFNRAFLEGMGEAEVDKDVVDDVPLAEDESGRTERMTRRPTTPGAPVIGNLAPGAAEELRNEIIDMTGSDELYSRFVDDEGQLRQLGFPYRTELAKAVEEEEISPEDAIELARMFDEMTRVGRREQEIAQAEDQEDARTRFENTLMGMKAGQGSAL